MTLPTRSLVPEVFKAEPSFGQNFCSSGHWVPHVGHSFTRVPP
jgi:hypothetical protein